MIEVNVIYAELYRLDEYNIEIPESGMDVTNSLVTSDYITYSYTPPYKWPEFT